MAILLSVKIKAIPNKIATIAIQYEAFSITTSTVICTEHLSTLIQSAELYARVCL